MNQPAADFPKLELTLPAWVADLVRPGDRYEEPEDRMRLAIGLALENVNRGTGGPFGAVVCERDTGRVLSVGVNRVLDTACSLAHAEVLAVGLAQRALGSHDLSASGLPDLELACSAQPCCQCFGVVWWSGIRGLLVGARASDVESIAGFQEGPLPDHWDDRLRNRAPLPPVAVTLDLLRSEALMPLRVYRQSGRLVYNPGRGQFHKP